MQVMPQHVEAGMTTPIWATYKQCVTDDDRLLFLCGVSTVLCTTQDCQ